MSENQDFEGMDRGSILMLLKMAVLTKCRAAHFPKS